MTYQVLRIEYDTDLFSVRSNSSGSIEVGEVRYYPMETNASKDIGLELDFYDVPGVARARKVRDEVGLAALSWSTKISPGATGRPLV